VALEQLRQRGLERLADRASVAQRGGGGGQHRAVALAGPLGRPREQDRALGRLAGEALLPGLELARDLVPPGLERVDPGLHGPLPAPGAVDAERALPAHAPVVGVDGDERRLVPVLVARPAPAHRGPHHVVPVAEDVGRHGHRVADGPLHGVATAVDRRSRMLDDDAARRLLRVRQGHGFALSRY
jgi:hypothetical protein